ncbi:phosphoglycolate phosphatase [Kerstersia sp.]|uniref:phosphoglycolate phosphatase n=1 Tax=Kerstersia sp. TaxID=1930783 RepID=UPI003F8D9EC4
MNPIELVLLDLDGTLLDTIPDLANAANHMRADLGLPPLPLALLATFVGKGMQVLVRRAMTGEAALDGALPDGFEQALARFQHHYRALNGAETRIYPGVIAGLDAMQAQGLRLAVVTNKPQAYTPPLLARMGLSGYFPIVICGDTCARKKPDAEPLLHACQLAGAVPAATVMIGDSINDTQAARAAGCAALAVSYGYNEGMDVQTLDVDGIVDTLLEAAGWIARRNQH